MADLDDSAKRLALMSRFGWTAEQADAVADDIPDRVFDLSMQRPEATKVDEAAHVTHSVYLDGRKLDLGLMQRPRSLRPVQWWMHVSPEIVDVLRKGGTLPDGITFLRALPPPNTNVPGVYLVEVSDVNAPRELDGRVLAPTFTRHLDGVVTIEYGTPMDFP